MKKKGATSNESDLSTGCQRPGEKGEVKEVSEGYARNFLFPRKLAVVASTGNLNTLKERERREEERKKEELSCSRQLAEKLEEAEITLRTKAGEGGRLFGSITSKQISRYLKRGIRPSSR